MDKQTLQETVSQVLDEMRERPIPLGVSSRHIHLSTADYVRLFPEQPISEKKPLLQPGQFAAEQVVTLVGPKGKLHNVRLLGPLRNASQVEIPGLMPERWGSPLRYACQAISTAHRGFV